MGEAEFLARSNVTNPLVEEVRITVGRILFIIETNRFARRIYQALRKFETETG